MNSSSQQPPSKNGDENNQKTDESKIVSETEDCLPFSGMADDDDEASHDGDDQDRSIPASVETNQFERKISALAADGNDSLNNEDNPQQEPLAADTNHSTENGTATTTDEAKSTDDMPTIPDDHQTGSFRFYSDEGIEAPDAGAQLRIADHGEEEKVSEDNRGILLPRHLALRSQYIASNSQADTRSTETGSITASVVNEPHPGLNKNNRVSSRLILAQETDMIPVNHSRGSEVSFKVKAFESMKQHLKSLVQAAEIHLQSTLELQQAHRTFFTCLADMADDTPLKGAVGTAANHGQETTVLNPQQVAVEEDFTTVQNEKYIREILRHAEDWLEACMVQVDQKQKEYQELERRYFHCNTKTARLRKRARNADSWNLEFVSQQIHPHLEKSEAELATLIQEHKDKANEVCFLLDEFTAHGWKDLYPLVESSMEWEVDRFQHDEDTNGQVLPVALETMQATFRMLQQEEMNKPRSVHGIAHLPQLRETEQEQDGGVEETKSETQEAPQLQIDPSKPTLFLDDADPFTARVWITLLEKEADPLHPTGFHVIPVCNINAGDPGLQLLNSINQKTSPVLVHNGNIFADSIRVSEYIDKAIRHPLYHSIPSLLPSRPIDTFNMKTFLKRHARISDVFYNLMDSDDDDARPQLAQELFDLLGMIDRDLQKFPGPYLCGSQFTLADVSIFPFVEHINIILASFGGTSIPESLSFLLEWYEVVSRRPSVQMVTGDPLNTGGTNDQGKTRVEYLIEYHQQRCDYVADA